MDAAAIIDDDFSTGDVGLAEESIGRVYRRGLLRETSAPFAFRQRTRGDTRVNVTRFEISSRADIAVDMEGVLGVGMREAGEYQASSNGRDVDPDSPFLLRPGKALSSSEHLDLVMVNLDIAALTSFAGGMHGTEHIRLHFTDVAPLSVVHAARWHQVTEFAGGVLTDPDLLLNDMMRQTAVDALFATALTAFPIEIVQDRIVPGDVVLPSAVRRAIRHMDDNADRPLPMEEIAAAARLSVRGLQAAFQQWAGITPGAYLRRVRLSGAHQDLLNHNPATATVGQVSRRWGFSNASRFAAAYVAAYGERPRDTLDR